MSDTTTLTEHEPRRRVLWVALAAGVLALLGLVGGGYAYASHYSDRALPGTTVGGQDVSSMTRQEIINLITNKAQEVKVTINGDVQASASLADLGTSVDPQATADAALKPSRSVLGRFKALVTSRDVKVVATSDKATIQAYTSSLIPADQTQAVDAAVVLAPDGASFTITGGTAGLSLDADAALSTARKAAAELKNQSLSLSFVTASPRVDDATAQSVATQANTWVAQEVTLTGEKGRTYTADAATKASWLTITPAAPDADSPAPVLSVDQAKVSQWVAEEAGHVNREPVNGVRNVNSSGQVVQTSKEAVDGVQVSNADALVAAIVQSIGSGQPYTGTFETQPVQATWTERQVADGAENLIYQAAPGERWVDVNLSNKTVTAYEGATVVRGPITVTDGATATPTVTGTFQVYLKYQTQTMRGTEADGVTPYETKDVPWVTYWHQGYAFHGAPWRSSFGGSGSHGCINMPVPEAQWIYNWADVGTTVVSHY